MRNDEITLDNCADEPIHIPGSIQSHGHLLVISHDVYLIQFISENCSSIFNKSKELLQTDATHILGKKFIGELANQLVKTQKKSFNLILNYRDVDYNAIIHNQKAHIIIELEPFQLPHQSISGFYEKSREFISDFSMLLDEEKVFNQAVNEVRKVTNFDRVMLYKFDEEYNGQVLAESKIESLNSFLHQHFPESDIPSQARELYVKNPIRLIADVDSPISPILPHAKILHLTDCGLRSVSPIHIQYLKNMKVKASMSISIVVEGRLWGLIACHHNSANIVSFDVREACVFFSQMLSYLITMRERTITSDIEGSLKALNATLIERMASEIDFEKGLELEIPTLLELVRASGVAWNLSGDIKCFGKTPSRKEVQSIMDWVAGSIKKDSVFYSHSIALRNPVFENLSEIASGILALPLSIEQNFFLIWFREEINETKNWGGKPEKIIEFTDDGSHRLMPRSSFKLWEQNVKYKSEPWKEVEVSAALKFRNSLMNYVLFQSERLKKLNIQLEQIVKERTQELLNEVSARKKTESKLKDTLREAQRSNAELDQFAYVASHDLQEPLRKIQSFGDRLIIYAKNLDERSSDYLKRMMNASARMQLLIQNLLVFSRISRQDSPFEKLKLEGVVKDVLIDLETLVEETGADIIYHSLGEVQADPHQIHRLFLNLIQNAIKFRKEGISPKIEISGEVKDEQLHVNIKDNGIGFDESYSHKIFGLFERLHGRQNYEGTGLGLAICQKIMDSHGGSITAKSLPGHGATFTLAFPI